MSKLQLIEAIRQINRGATEDFLRSFDEPALSRYLDHLNYRLAPRGVRAVWVRPADTAAMVTRPARHADAA